MAFFTKKTWVARQGTGLNKFSINGATPVTVVNQPDSVTEQGDALSATNLNNLEQRIYNAFLDVDGVFDNIEDGIVLVGRAKADQNGDIIDETYAKQNGYYAELGAGTAEQLVSTQTVDDDDAYLFRTSGGSADIGNRETDEIVGGTLGVNQPIVLDSWIASGHTGVLSYASNKVTFTVNANATALLQLYKYQSYASLPLPKGHKILITATIESTVAINSATFRCYPIGGGTEVNVSANSRTTVANIFSANDNTTGREFGLVGNMTLSSGDVISLVNPMLIDLTAMFGSEIADYIYALEQATAGAGVAWFRRYFPKPYYPYNAGGLSSVKPSSHDMTGFNQWDEVWELGDISTSTGANITDANRIRSKNLIPVFPNTTYYFKCPKNVYLYRYDANGNYVSYADFAVNNTFVVSQGVHFIRFAVNSSYGTTYQNDICINISWSGTRNGEYEPFELHSYPLDDSTEYRGIPKLDADGNLYFDGDVYKSSGDVTRKYGIVDMGDMDWTYNSQYDSFMSSTLSSVIKASGSDGVKVNVFTPKYTTTTFWARTAKSISQGNPSKNLYVTDGNYSTVADFKTGVTGQKLIYELATPTQETVNPFTNPQIVNDWGTEQYVDARDVPIPVGHNTQYMANLRDKLQHLPNLANADGEYVVKQTGTQMELVKTDNLKKDGYYPTLAVGTADNLKGKGTVGANFTFRTSGGSDDIGSGSARIDRINGNTLMLNQQVYNGNFVDGYAWNSSGSLGVSVANNKATLTSSAVSAFYEYVTSRVKQGHKYYYRANINTSASSVTVGLYRNSSAYIYNSTNVQNTTVLVDGIGQISDSIEGYTFDFRIRINDGSSATTIVSNVMLIDLTQMFGSGNEPTLDEFKALFPLDYYDYTEGFPLNFKGTGLKTVGFNQFDDSVLGSISGMTKEGDYWVANNGVWNNATSVVGWSKIKFILNQTYCISLDYEKPSAVTSIQIIFKYTDGTTKVTSRSADSGKIEFVSDSGKSVADFWISYGSGSGDFKIKNLNVNFRWSDIRNGEYEPYWDSTLDLPITTVRGKASGSDESVVIFPDGMKSARNARDELTAKKGIVRLAIVDLGNDLRWDYITDTSNVNLRSKTALDNAIAPATQNDVIDAKSSTYAVNSYNEVCWGSVSSGQIGLNTNKKVVLTDSGISASDIDSSGFCSKLVGKYLVYEIASIEYTLDEELNLNYRVDDFGTEQLLPENTSTPTTSPLVAEIAYAMNAVDTLRNLDKNFTNLATLDALIAIINSKCGVTITRGSFDSANNRYTFS